MRKSHLLFEPFDSRSFRHARNDLTTWVEEAERQSLGQAARSNLQRGAIDKLDLDATPLEAVEAPPSAPPVAAGPQGDSLPDSTSAETTARAPGVDSDQRSALIEIRIGRLTLRWCSTGRPRSGPRRGTGVNPGS
jgi:hypothetical protein